jgi:dTDP-4-amino-4,6-dideoxygalactose transaminase
VEVNFYTSIREYKEKRNEFDEAISKVLTSGKFIMGDEVKELEDLVIKYTGVKYAIAVASGTDALVLASDILGFKEGKEIITSPFTFFSSVSCLYRNKAKPVFVDIDEDTFNIDTSLIEEKINENTIGILPVHLFSQMVNMDKVMSIAKKNDLKVLEDAAESFGMRWIGNGEKLRHSGTIGDMGIYSFFPTKTLGAYGDAGMIVTNDKNLNRLARSFRVHGATKKYHHDYVGYNSRLDTIQAAILKVKMKYIDEAIEKREKAADWYNVRLSGCEDIILPIVKGNQKPVYYVFNIKVKRRDELQKHLKENSIQTTIYYPKPLHLQKCFEGLGYKKGDFPIAEKLCNEVLALPLYPEIREDEVDYVCEKIIRFF